MKRLLWISLVIFVMVPAAAWAQSGTVVLKDIEIPENLTAGDHFQLSFKLENAWYQQMKEIYVYLDGGFPFLEKSPTEAQFILNLHYVEPWKRSQRLSFDLQVDEDAKAGIYPLNVVVTYRTYRDSVGMSGGYNRYTEVIPLKISVRGTPRISVFVTKSDPVKIKAGDLARLDLSVVNMGTEKAENLLLFTRSADYVDVLWYSTGFYVGDVLPQDAGRASVKLDVDDSAPAGEYSLPVTVMYETPEGERVSQETSINLVVEEKADFKVAPGANSVDSGTNENRITFVLENTGTRAAEEVKAILKATYPFTPTGNEYYVGSLEPGEAKEMVFHVDVDSDADTQPYPVDVIIQWKEDSTEYTDTKASFIQVTHVESRDWEYLGAGLGAIVLLVILRKIVLKIKKRGGKDAGSDR
ncbi:MAG: hypothetical protein GXO65_03175 [Euryarchaeota archaeon]|nr:hypothetical protein [Euryarchaeota archaeon]